MSVKHGPVVKYLGMLIDISEDGRVVFLMIDYLEDVLSECTKYDMTGTAVWPAYKDSFEIDKNAPKLSSMDGDFFHRFVTKLLFAAKCAWPDIQLAVSFLCTRVKYADVDDMRKLKRCVKYIQETIYIPLILGWNKSGDMVWSIDASFAVHMDMKSHTGSTLSLGLGSAISGSHKQKNNTNSTTVSELHGIGDTMPMIKWTSNFTKAQVNGIPEKDDNTTQAIKSLDKVTTMLQDKASTKCLTEFGCRWQGKNTRHVEI